MKAKDELEKLMREKQDQEHRMQQFKEIDRRLQEIVPKIAETNTICREVYRDNVMYEPAISTEVLPDGTKVS
jgi:hypothetical protein